MVCLPVSSSNTALLKSMPEGTNENIVFFNKLTTLNRKIHFSINLIFGISIKFQESSALVWLQDYFAFNRKKKTFPN
jgi:hypothetical protein